MSLVEGGATEGSGPVDRSHAVHDVVRGWILDGLVDAGAPLSQVELARTLGVSRGPVREALRMLEREGLVHAEPGRQVRVASISVEDMEQIYALRVLAESLAVRVTVPSLSEEQIALLVHLQDQLAESGPHDWDEWERLHRAFHAVLSAGAGKTVLDDVNRLQDHSARYRRIHLAGGQHALAVGALDHHDLLRAARAGDGDRAGRLVALHLAGTALSVIGRLWPAYEPVLLRAAVRLGAGTGS